MMKIPPSISLTWCKWGESLMLHVILLLVPPRRQGGGTEGEGQGRWRCSTEWDSGSGLIYGDPRERDRGRKGR